jgi:lysine 2,3-aminomutase
MSSDSALERILDAVYQMAKAKREANRKRKKKYAEIQRVRLGTRLPVYLPQRMTPGLTQVLAQFKERASEIGVKQFLIQSHFESPMEVTPEARDAVQGLLSAGWIVTNQLVFTAAASRRGHTAKLRKSLNDIGVLPYYTFVQKGYRENSFNYAPVARAVQEEMEEKAIGRIPERYHDSIRLLPEQADSLLHEVGTLRGRVCVPFLATDRSVLNLPAVGKSLTFRVIGITRYGRRILEFDHDRTRAHSPIIDQTGKVVVIESKSIREYLQQLDDLGEDISQYESCYGYSIGQSESRMPSYEYPPFDFAVTDQITNLVLSSEKQPVSGAQAARKEV